MFIATKRVCKNIKHNHTFQKVEFVPVYVGKRGKFVKWVKINTCEIKSPFNK